MQARLTNCASQNPEVLKGEMTYSEFKGSVKYTVLLDKRFTIVPLGNIGNISNLKLPELTKRGNRSIAIFQQDNCKIDLNQKRNPIDDKLITYEIVAI